MAERQNNRRSPRFPFETLRTEMNFGGRSYPVRISDLSQEGVRLIVDGSLNIAPQQEVQIGVGKINPNVKGRVRWIARDDEDPKRLELGIEFVSFMISQPEDDEIQHVLEAWQDISQSYSHYESFWHILVLLDFEIVEGKINDLSDAIFSIAVWIDQRLGPLNVWGVLKEQDGSLTCIPMVERHQNPGENEAARIAHVSQVAQEELTAWFDGHPYLFGGDIVIEYLGTDEGNADLLQRMAAILSRRMQFWSKLLMKNISLQLLGEEMERKRS